MEKERRFDALTSLRGIFILVIAVHNTMLVHPYLFQSLPGSGFLSLFGGSLGNSMFFMLSGYGMSYSYRDRIQRHAISFVAFLGKKLRKLYPIYLITNLAALLLAVVQYGMSAINLERIAATLLLNMGGGLAQASPYNTPTWFLCTLFLCYIVFFIAASYSKTDTRYHCAIALGILCGYAFLTSGISVSFCQEGNGIGLMNFFIGCALAEIYPWIKGSARKWLGPVSLVTLLFFLWLLHSYGVGIICGNVDIAFGFCVCPLILFLALIDGPCSRILRWKPFVFLGNISGSIFFWHLVVYYGFSILYALFHPGQDVQEKSYLLYFAGMLVWSTFSHKAEERVRRHRAALPDTP